MVRKGPLLTLLGGLALAGLLVAANVHAAGRSIASATGQPPASSAGVLSPTAAAPAPTPSPSASAAARLGTGTYAGYTNDGAASIAIAVKDGHVIAYLCDGSKVEAWLQGSAVSGGALGLHGTHTSSLTGSVAAGKVTGTVVVGGRTWSYHAKLVHKPSGLYRASAEVRGAKVVGGWIVVNNLQVGIVTLAGQPVPAPRLDPVTGQVTVNGVPLKAVPVDGDPL